MFNQPTIWLKLQLPEGIKKIFSTAVEILGGKDEVGSAFELKFVLAAISTSLENGEPETAESVADFLVSKLLSLSFKPRAMHYLMPYLTGSYLKALEISSPDREIFLRVKFGCMYAIQQYFTVYTDENEKESKLKEVENISSNIVLHYWEAILGPKPADQSYQESLKWIIKAFPKIEKECDFAAEQNYFLGHFIFEWIRKELMGDLGLRVQIPNALSRFKELNRQNAACIIKCGEFWKAADLPFGQFEFLEKACFTYLLETGDLTEGLGLLEEALKIGDSLVFKLQLQGESKHVLDLRGRLYHLARFTGDKDEIAYRLDLHCDHIRKEADKFYINQHWLDAANYYSNLGYRYFNTAEYCSNDMLYQLSIYFFEKAEYCRKNVTDDPGVSPDGKKYRWLEASGFIYGASAKLSDHGTALSFLDDAAIDLTEASRVVFGQIGLSEFYSSTAHHFHAHAHLLRAVHADQFSGACAHIRDSLEAFSRCFRGFKNVYNAYREILKSIVEPERKLDIDMLTKDLIKNSYPKPAYLLALATDLRQKHQDVDLNGFKSVLDAVRSALIYINPMG